MERIQFRGVCKQCGDEYRYTELAYFSDILHGRSPSTRCDNCRHEHKKFVTSFGISYFPALQETDIEKKLNRLHLTGLAHIKRVLPSPEREVYAGTPTPKAARKFTAVAPTMDALVEAVESHGSHCPRFIITVLPTGAGKSVYLPYRLLLSKASQLGKIYVTEPRLSVLKPKKAGGKGTIPWYIGTQLLQAPEPGYGKGFEIGVKYAGESSMVDHYNNRLIFVSDGLLIRMALTGELSNVSVVVIDEAHEKSANMVTLFTLFKIVLPRYPKLKVVFASATVDPQEFVNFYHPAPVQVLQPLGITTQASITINWSNQSGRNTLEQYRERWGYWDFLDEAELPAIQGEPPNEQSVPEAVAAVVKGIRNIEGFSQIDKPMGDIIVFVATKKILYQTVDAVKAQNLANLKIYPCHAEMKPHEHDRFDKSEQRAKRIQETNKPKTEQRVIIGTNYIETGITITADYVIDSGYVLEPRWRADLCTTEYNVERLSRDKAKQRWGRIGRLSNCPGEVFCLYTKDDFEERPEYTPSEITRTNLDSVYLTLKAAGIEDVENIPIFGFDDQKPAQRQEKERALRQLPLTGAVDDDGDITFRGRLIDGTRTSLVNYGLLLVHAEELGCHLEVATFLAFIERSGTEGLFIETDQGLLAYERWRTGVLDDLEFYLRLFLHWQKAAEKTREHTHRQWSEDQGLNHDTFLKVDRKREELLREFQRGVHVTSAVRYFDLRRLHRVRGAIARAMPEWLFLYESGAGVNMTFVPADWEACPSLISSLKIDQDSACARTRQLKAFICIDRSLVKEVVYARHVVAVEKEWIEYLHDATVVRLSLLLRESFARETDFTREVKHRIETLPSYSVDFSQYYPNQLLRLQVIRSRQSDIKGFDCYLVLDIERNVPLIIQTKDIRVLAGDKFQAVVIECLPKSSVIQVSKNPLIQKIYPSGSIVDGKILTESLTNDKGLRYAVFVRLETGIEGLLSRQIYSFWSSSFDKLQEGDTVKVQVQSIQEGKITLAPPIREFKIGEYCNGYVKNIKFKNGQINNVHVQLSPRVFGILYKERTTFIHLNNIEKGVLINVKILELTKGGRSQYLLAHRNYGSEPKIGYTYKGTVVGFHLKNGSRLMAFIDFYPGIENGVLHYKKNNITDLNEGDTVNVILQNIEKRDRGKIRYSLTI